MAVTKLDGIAGFFKVDVCVCVVGVDTASLPVPPHVHWELLLSSLIGKSTRYSRKYRGGEGTYTTLGED